MIVLYIFLGFTYFVLGLYVSGRFGFSVSSSASEEEVAGGMICPFFWPLFLLYRFLKKCWEMGHERPYKD